MKMLSCKETSALISQGLDRRLSWRERVGLRLHLLICDACKEFKRQAEFLRAAAQRAAQESLMRLSPAARERMRHLLQQSNRE